MDEALEGAPTRPALPNEQVDALMQKLVSTRRFCCLPANILTFYKTCDGLDFPAIDPRASHGTDASAVTCTIRSLAGVELTNCLAEACSHSDEYIKVAGTFFLRFADFSDGSYVVVELSQEARILHISPAQMNWGVLEDSLPSFIRELTAHGGRMYKDCIPCSS
jgi:hypothetical protein